MIYFLTPPRSVHSLFHPPFLSHPSLILYATSLVRPQVSCPVSSILPLPIVSMWHYHLHPIPSPLFTYTRLDLPSYLPSYLSLPNPFFCVLLMSLIRFPLISPPPRKFIIYLFRLISSSAQLVLSCSCSCLYFHFLSGVCTFSHFYPLSIFCSEVYSLLPPVDPSSSPTPTIPYPPFTSQLSRCPFHVSYLSSVLCH